jgi:hypothetical protein
MTDRDTLIKVAHDAMKTIAGQDTTMAEFARAAVDAAISELRRNLKVDFLWIDGGAVLACNADVPEDDPMWVIGNATDAMRAALMRQRKADASIARTVGQENSATDSYSVLRLAPDEISARIECAWEV